MKDYPGNCVKCGKWLGNGNMSLDADDLCIECQASEVVGRILGPFRARMGRKLEREAIAKEVGGE